MLASDISVRNVGVIPNTHDLQSWIPCHSGSSRFCTLARYLTLCLPDKVSGKIAAIILTQLESPAMEEVLRFYHSSQPRFILGYIHSKQKVSCTRYSTYTSNEMEGYIPGYHRKCKTPFPTNYNLSTAISRLIDEPFIDS